MKFLAIALVALLACALQGCSHVQEYNPALSSAPQDGAAYNRDLAVCRDVAASPAPLSAGQSLAIGGLGLAGLAGAAMVDGGDDAFKSPYTIIDECMAKKGYAVKRTPHCC